MREAASALFVHYESEPFGALEKALEGQSVRVCHASNCREASRLLQDPDPPQLVFTDTTLPDGTWADVAGLAAKAPSAVNVIVVARWVDMRLYVEVIENGAFDFLAPPFVPLDLAHVVRCAVENAVGRRHGQADAA
jgi:DNA-binding NtrC family response regulator